MAVRYGFQFSRFRVKVILYEFSTIEDLLNFSNCSLSKVVHVFILIAFFLTTFMYFTLFPAARICYITIILI